VLRPGLIQGANLAARRAVFDGIGGFDPELGAGARYRCEDVDFVARALAGGWRAVYDPSLVVYHDHGRREGEGLDALRDENAFAAGAYLAKMISLGHWRYAGLLAVMLGAAPLRRNIRLRRLLAGFRDWRARAAERASPGRDDGPGGTGRRGAPP
jgi:GT2 family glycosyltransferase